MHVESCNCENSKYKVFMHPFYYSVKYLLKSVRLKIVKRDEIKKKARNI